MWNCANLETQSKNTNQNVMSLSQVRILSQAPKPPFKAVFYFVFLNSHRGFIFNISGFNGLKVHLIMS